jgi:hypothetical protein
VEKDKGTRGEQDGLDGTNSPQLVPLGEKGRGRRVWTDSDGQRPRGGSEKQRDGETGGGEPDRKEGQRNGKVSRLGKEDNHLLRERSLS